LTKRRIWAGFSFIEAGMDAAATVYVSNVVQGEQGPFETPKLAE
jgi:hypothetical protein